MAVTYHYNDREVKVWMACDDDEQGLNSDLAGINSGLADFLRGFDVRPAVPVYVCVNVADQMKKGRQPVCGQLWTQEDRQQIAISMQFPYPGADLDKSREHTALWGWQNHQNGDMPWKCHRTIHMRDQARE
jgi:hypothetical protein